MHNSAALRLALFLFFCVRWRCCTAWSTGCVSYLVVIACLDFFSEWNAAELRWTVPPHWACDNPDLHSQHRIGNAARWHRARQQLHHGRGSPTRLSHKTSTTWNCNTPPQSLWISRKPGSADKNAVSGFEVVIPVTWASCITKTTFMQRSHVPILGFEPTLYKDLLHAGWKSMTEATTVTRTISVAKLQVAYLMTNVDERQNQERKFIK